MENLVSFREVAAVSFQEEVEGAAASFQVAAVAPPLLAGAADECPVVEVAYLRCYKN